jgi:hypothetical protein
MPSKLYSVTDIHFSMITEKDYGKPLTFIMGYHSISHMSTSFQQKIIEIEASGLSLTDLAGLIGLSVQAASDIKQGRTKEPRGLAAIALADLHRKCLKKKPAPKIQANKHR